MSNKENKYIVIKNKKVSIGLKWIKIEKQNKLARERIAATYIKESGLNYGSLFDYKEDNISLLALTDENNKNSAIGAQIIAEKIGYGIFFTEINVDEEEKDKRLFWFVAIDENGRVIPEMDLILSEDELASNVSQFQSIYDEIKIFAPKKDQSVFPDDDFETVILEDFIENENIGKYAVKFLKKQTNYPLLATSIILLSVSSYIGYEYIYKENPIINEIKNGILTESVLARVDEKKNIQEKNKNNKNLSQEDYNELANKQINEIFDKQFFNNEDIINNLALIRKIIPEYLVEWQLINIKYEKNLFVFSYKRIDGSTGSYNEINLNIKNILSKKGYKYEFLGNNDDLSLVSYVVYFESEKEKEYFKKKAIEDRLESEKKDPTEHVFKEIENIKNEINNLEYSVTDLSWIDKRWGKEPNNIKDKIIEKVSLIDNELIKIKKINESEKEDLKLKNLKIREDKKRYDNYLMLFLNKTQINQQYLFSTPVKISSLPYIEEEKNKKKKTKKSKKENIILRPLVDIYEFSISSKEYSIGLDQAYQAMSIIDNKSIIYNNVNYDIKTNNWNIRGTMYEKN